MLETATGGTSQDTERIRPSKEHSHSGDGVRRVRTHRESNRARGTHFLETASGGTRQDRERIIPSEGHSPTGTGDGVGGDK